MNQTMLDGAELGAAMTDAEMAELVGGKFSIAYACGFAVGYLGGIIVNGATNADLQPYSFGA